MTWRRPANKPLAGPIATYFNDAYASLGLDETSHPLLYKITYLLRFTAQEAHDYDMKFRLFVDSVIL